MAVEEPSCDVLAVHGDIEFRRYSAFVVAQTSVPAEVERPAAANRAFMKVLRYIRGDNAASAQIAMTAQVMQQRGVSPAASVPGEPNVAESDWRVSFVLPVGFSLANAPVPADPGIKVQEIPARVVAALAYWGRWTENECRPSRRSTAGALAAAGHNAPRSGWTRLLQRSFRAALPPAQ